MPCEVLLWLNCEDAGFEGFLAETLSQGWPVRVVGRSPENRGMSALPRAVRAPPGRAAGGGGQRDEQAPAALEVDLGLLGGAAVMDAHVALCEAERDPVSSGRERAAALAELLKAMRRDLGHAQGLAEASLEQVVHDGLGRTPAAGSAGAQEQRPAPAG